MGKGRDEIRRRHAESAKTAMRESRAAASTDESHRTRRIARMGAKLSVPPSTVNGTELGSQECRDYLLLRYGIKPPDLTEHCNICGAEFDICHAFDCKKVGLITARHNMIRYGVADLTNKAFTPMHVCENPKIYTGCAMRGGKEKLKGSPSKYKGEL